MKYVIFYTLFILFNLNGNAQENIKGFITSDNQVIPYALIYHSSNQKPIYSDSLGIFKLNNVYENDTITVKCIGFEEKIVKIKNINKPLKIELQRAETLLDEVVINVINSNWERFFNKPKAHLWPTSIGIPEGFSAITKYKSQNDVKFNGITFIAKNSINEYQTKKMRLLIFKKAINPTNSLIESEIVVFDIPKNNSGKLNKEDFRLEFVFNHIIELKKDEEIYIGLELIPNNIENINLKDGVMFATVKEMNNPNLETKLYPFLFNDNFRGNYYKEVPLKEDLYFELKVVK